MAAPVPMLILLGALVPAVGENVQERAENDERIWQHSKDMGAVLSEEEEPGEGSKSEEHPGRPRHVLSAWFRLIVMEHTIPIYLFTKCKSLFVQ